MTLTRIANRTFQCARNLWELWRQGFAVLWIVPLLLLNGWANAQSPNVVLIVADDLGFSDLGCYGSEIDTPNLDALAQGGMRYTQFYNTGRCWPTRACLMTGYYAQQVRRDTVEGIKSGGGGTRPSWAKLLPVYLRSKGYRSYHSGKWHIDGLPLDNGFDHSYSLNDHDRHFAPKQHTLDDRALPAVSKEETYYSSTAIAQHAIDQIEQHNREHTARPFFSFVAFTAPHFPLHAPEQDIEKYRGRYANGWDAMRLSRHNKMQSLGMSASLSSIEREVGPPYAFPDAMKKLGPNEVNRPSEWKSMTVEQQRFQSEKMAVHAAMVDRMDQEIGRIVECLKRVNRFENTLILFLSDNGASAEIMVRGDGHNPDSQCGTAATFLSLGPGWSSFCNTPFRRHKTWVHEGGICTPMIAHWPMGLKSRERVCQRPFHAVDLFSTISDVAGVQRQDQLEAEKAPDRPGLSLLPTFGDASTGGHEELWWMHEKNRALRQGDWKIVASGEGAAWELYNLKSDRTEMKNVASQHSEIVAAMAKRWNDLVAQYSADAVREPIAEPSGAK